MLNDNVEILLKKCNGKENDSFLGGHVYNWKFPQDKSGLTTQHRKWTVHSKEMNSILFNWKNSTKTTELYDLHEFEHNFDSNKKVFEGWRIFMKRNNFQKTSWERCSRAPTLSWPLSSDANCCHLNNINLMVHNTKIHLKMKWI